MALSEVFSGPYVSLYAVDEANLSAAEWGLVVTLTQGISIPAIPALGRLMDRYGKFRVMVALLIGDSIAMLIFVAGSIFGFLVFVAYPILYVFYSSTFIAFQTISAEVIPIAYRTQGFIVLQAISSVVAASLSTLGGALYQYVSPKLL